MTRYPIASREPLRVELEAFRDAVRDHTAPRVGAHDGMVALAVAEALVRSSEEGLPVSVPAVSVSA
jgi:predicted dehydrogenase